MAEKKYIDADSGNLKVPNYTEYFNYNVPEHLKFRLKRWDCTIHRMLKGNKADEIVFSDSVPKGRYCLSETEICKYLVCDYCCKYKRGLLTDSGTITDNQMNQIHQQHKCAECRRAK